MVLSTSKIFHISICGDSYVLFLFIFILSGHYPFPYPLLAIINKSLLPLIGQRGKEEDEACFSH